MAIWAARHGPARARSCSCLTQSGQHGTISLSCRAVPAHGLSSKPRHGPQVLGPCRAGTTARSAHWVRAGPGTFKQKTTCSSHFLTCKLTMYNLSLKITVLDNLDQLIHSFTFQIRNYKVLSTCTIAQVTKSQTKDKIIN